MGEAARKARQASQAAALSVRIIMPGLPIAGPDPFAVSLGGSETAGHQLAAELVRQGTIMADRRDATPFGGSGPITQPPHHPL